MTSLMLFDTPTPPGIPVVGQTPRFPVGRIFCVGRNYADHAAEMGNEVDRENPIYFTKSPAHLCLSGSEIAYPRGTTDCHHEVELVVALGPDGLFGYACGIDLTRRDLQSRSKDRRRPWDTGKDFENAAVIGEITPAALFGSVAGRRIALAVNGQTRQSADLGDMIWSVPEILSDLGRLYDLRAGDLIYTGTPAGVAAIAPGDTIRAEIDGLSPLTLQIEAETGRD